MSSRPRTLVALTAGAILGFCGALTSGVLADRPSEAAHSGHASRPVDGTALPWQEASLFAEVYERIKRDYVDDVDDHGLMEKALRGMVARRSASPRWAPIPASASRSSPRTGS